MPKLGVTVRHKSPAPPSVKTYARILRHMKSKERIENFENLKVWWPKLTSALVQYCRDNNNEEFDELFRLVYWQ